MLPDKVILDDKSFKALSAESRVGILKNLNNRRMTLSELSKKMSLEASTIKEHCSLLVDADLIKQIDEGRKWKYYELTGKGKSLIEPNLMEQVRVLVLLCFGAILFGGLIMFALNTTLGFSASSSAQNISETQLSDNTQIMKSAPEVTDEPLLATAIAGERNMLTNEPSQNTSAAEEITREFFVASLTLALLAGLIIGWTCAKKY